MSDVVTPQAYLTLRHNYRRGQATKGLIFICASLPPDSSCRSREELGHNRPFEDGSYTLLTSSPNRIELLAARKIEVYATNKADLFEMLTSCRARA